MHFILNSKIKNINFSKYILIIFLLINSSNNYIVLPFKTTNIPINNINKISDNPVEDFLSKININKIYTSISLGTPENNIDFYFSMNEYITSIDLNSCLINSKSTYNPSYSKSFKNIQNLNNFKLSNEQCSIYNDLNLTDIITFNTFEFYLRENGNDINNLNLNLIELNKYCGTIGLRRFSSNSIFDKDSFIYNLKKNNIINSYSYGIFFFDSEKSYNIDDDTQESYDGFFIAGVTMDDNIDIFNTDLVCSVYAEEDSIYWTLNFDRIFYYDKINDTVEYISTNNTRAELIVDLNYIISDEQYYKDIKKYYFKPFFDNKTCYEEESYKIDEGYTYMIICDINFKNNMKSFPGVYFYSESLFFAFNIYYTDIFYEYNNKIYFLVIHKDSIKNYWRLGKIFLKKYPFMFDYDKKIINYVHLKKEWNPKKQSKKQKDKINEKHDTTDNIDNYRTKEYAIIILLIIGVFIGLFIGKRIWNKNNKLKANELEENYQYLEHEKSKIGI